MFGSTPHTIRNIFYTFFNYERPSLYPQCHQSTELHQDKVSRYASQSTDNFLEKMEQEMIIKYPSLIFLRNLLMYDMDFCAFELLKYALSKRRKKAFCGLWRGMGQNTFPDTTNRHYYYGSYDVER
ncbi:hypothetical protein AVEN_58668-1 [Araneus ventricosus]|uniref:Uncharacterized protein n=1 Tax=Araneus ventricosus TaxID=182803 RepID=A0A4Y2I8E0_ARAVE|nr:hypothetical protein AVEN_58668-1 [Araneus ventricosus]